MARQKKTKEEKDYTVILFFFIFLLIVLHRLTENKDVQKNDHHQAVIKKNSEVISEFTFYIPFVDRYKFHKEIFDSKSFKISPVYRIFYTHESEKLNNVKSGASPDEEFFFFPWSSGYAELSNAFLINGNSNEVEPLGYFNKDMENCSIRIAFLHKGSTINDDTLRSSLKNKGVIAVMPNTYNNYYLKSYLIHQRDKLKKIYWANSLNAAIPLLELEKADYVLFVDKFKNQGEEIIEKSLIPEGFKIQFINNDKYPCKVVFIRNKYPPSVKSKFLEMVKKSTDDAFVEYDDEVRTNLKIDFMNTIGTVIDLSDS